MTAMPSETREPDEIARQKVRYYGPSMAYSITMALGDTDASLRSLCRAAVIAAMDIIEGKAPWFALSSVTIGMAGEDADALRDRLYALRERLAASDTQTEGDDAE